MYESDMTDETPKIKVDVTMEIYLQGKDDPIRPVITFCFDRTRLEEGNELSSFMNIATLTLKEIWDRKSEPWFILSDRLFNKFVIPTDQVQGVSILAPDSSLIQALEIDE